MTFQTYFTQASAQLISNGIKTARLDIFVLMEDSLGIDRAQLLAHPDFDIAPATQKLLDTQITRRARHEPLAYIRSKSEFYGREFIITSSVLVPRPESETMIELLLKLLSSEDILEQMTELMTNRAQARIANRSTVSRNENTDSLINRMQIADVGTGSGALGITAALEVPNSHVDLLEINPDAINTAKRNVINFATGQNVIESDLLSNAPRNYDVLLCNLPYVPLSYEINDAAKHEPKIALFAGEDGLDLYRKLFQQINQKQIKPLLILTEALPFQHDALKAIAKKSGYKEHTRDDFIQAFTLNK